MTMHLSFGLTEIEYNEVDALILTGVSIPNHDYARDDGLDEINNDLETDWRTCPVDQCDHALNSTPFRSWEGHSDSLWLMHNIS